MISILIRACNAVIESVGAALVWVLSLLPDTPFGSPSIPPSSVNLGYVTWLIDFPTMLQHLVILLGAIGIYYAVRVAARWTKIARN
ncbi:hypothetical protein ACE3MS_31310 [Paenibacillus dendritiformis]|uniref:hypothetical protein n=1 Tax=Paenibacillus dendritiformis TaxID=130049 RepID=UPI0036624A38